MRYRKDLNLDVYYGIVKGWQTLIILLCQAIPFLHFSTTLSQGKFLFGVTQRTFSVTLGRYAPDNLLNALVNNEGRVKFGAVYRKENTLVAPNEEDEGRREEIGSVRVSSRKEKNMNRVRECEGYNF